MRVALVHYWLVADRGGEKVLRAIGDLFPEADIFTCVAARDAREVILPQRTIRESFVAKLPFARRAYKAYLPLMPIALEQFDLQGYDLVISSESGPAKGVIPAPDALHVCYCHSPMRYVWDQYHLYRDRASGPARFAMPTISHYLRQWDVSSAARVDGFIANSSHVRRRIHKYYRRSSLVVPPPVDVSYFAANRRNPSSAFCGAYLWAGQLTAYKRPDLAIDACKKLGRRLFVIGDGEDLNGLRSKKCDLITFLGRVDRETLAEAYANAEALLFPGEEDFGITPVEAMAAGTPVIAFARGGALDTVVDGVTGMFFDEDSVESLVDAIERFERVGKSGFEKRALQGHARKYDVAAFKTKFSAALDTINDDLKSDGVRTRFQPTH